MCPRCALPTLSPFPPHHLRRHHYHYHTHHFLFIVIPVWNDRSISLSSKIRLMRFLVTSIFLYACESWTLTAELQRRIQAMKMRCYRKVLRISYKEHVTNEEVLAKIQQAIGPHEDLQTMQRDANRSGMVMSPIHQVWPKPSCKAQ